jgi:hypothetical protein
MKRRHVKSFHDNVMPERWYRSLDAGIRFAVRVLHAEGFETCQSCQGGKGHAYDRPSVDLPAAAADAAGLAAVHALQQYGVDVDDVSIVWPVRNGLPYEKLWRITLRRTYEDRADDIPIFMSARKAMR